MCSTQRAELIAALATCINNAPPEDTARLGECLSNYAQAYQFAYRDLTKGKTLIASILDTIEECTEAMIPRDQFGNVEKM